MEEEINTEDQFGKSLWTEEEIQQFIADEEQRKREMEEKLANGFFTDGGVRTVFIQSDIKENKVGKASGKPYVLHTYKLQDALSGQIETVIDYDFAVTNALDPIKKTMGVNFKCGITVLTFRTEKKGEKTFNGITSPIWKHTVTEGDANQVSQDKTDIAAFYSSEVQPAPFE